MKNKWIIKNINWLDFEYWIEYNNLEQLKKENKKLFDYINDKNSWKHVKYIDKYINDMYWYETAYQIIQQNLKENKNILIYGDYDSDWTNAWINIFSIINILKKKLNSKSEIKIKHSNRVEWYGIKPEIIKENKGFFNKYDLMIVVDLWCSVDFTGIENNNIIVFDHHIPQLDKMSDKIFYVNPIIYWRTKDKEAFNKINLNAIKTKYNFIKEEDIKDDIIQKTKNNSILELSDEICAWLLTSFFAIYVIKNKLDDKYRDLVKFYILTGTITTITDMMPQNKIINYIITNIWIKVFNLFYEKNKDTKNYKSFFSDNVNNFIDKSIIGDIMYWYLWLLLDFKVPFNYYNLWFVFGPYFNSFWRTITPEYLIYKLLKKEKDNFFNELRKKRQEDIKWKMVNSNMNKKVNIINVSKLFNNIEDNEKKYQALVKTFMYWIKNNIEKDFNIFDNFYNEKWINKDIIKKLEKDFNVSKLWKHIDDLYFLEGIVWLIASRINTGYLWIAGVEKNGVIVCSWRSKIDFEEHAKYLKEKWLIKDFWWHNKAFWIQLFTDKLDSIEKYLDKNNIIPKLDVDYLFNNNIDKKAIQILEYSDKNNLFSAFTFFAKYTVNSVEKKVSKSNKEYYLMKIKDVSNYSIMIFDETIIKAIEDKRIKENDEIYVKLHNWDWTKNTQYNNYSTFLNSEDLFISK